MSNTSAARSLLVNDGVVGRALSAIRWLF